MKEYKAQHVVSILQIFVNLLIEILCSAGGASQVVLLVKNPPPNAGDLRRVRSLGQEDPLEEGTATHSSILPWSIPWTGAWRATVHRVSQSQTQLK